MTYTQTSIIPINGLPLAASIVQLCDSVCVAMFNNDKVNVRHNNKLVANFPRTKNGLYTILIPASNMHHTHIANLVMSTLVVKTAQELVAFMHAAVGYPVLST